MQRRTMRIAGVLVILLILSSCSLGASSSGELEYSGPTEQKVMLGETLPGTDISYVGYSEDGAEVLIGDQKAVKKTGNSLDWSGTPVPGVEVTQVQRVLLANAEQLQTVGTVKIIVQDAVPTVAQFPDQPTYRYKVAVIYTVKRGEAIPGTTVTYVRKTDSGAQLSGISGFPYRKLGDSIAWSGRLRSNVYLDMTLRVIAYTNNFMQVGGLAVIGLTDE